MFIFKNLHVIGTMVGSMRDTDAALGYAARASPLPSCSMKSCVANSLILGTSETNIREISNQQTSRSCSETARREGGWKMCCGFQLIVEANSIANGYFAYCSRTERNRNRGC
jgi:hypothetical protein